LRIDLDTDAEKEFHQIKTIVAQRHKHFMTVIEKEEDKFIGQNVLNLVKRVISLKEFGKLSSVEINKISIEWHDANILLNEILGALEWQYEQAKKGIHTGPTESSSDAGEKKKKKKGRKSAHLGLGFTILVVLGAVAFLFRDQIQATPFYQEYLSGYVTIIQDTFSSE